jgi:hypothetical protein
VFKFGNNTYPRRIRRRSNLGHIFQGKKCVLWAGKYGNSETYLCTLLEYEEEEKVVRGHDKRTWDMRNLSKTPSILLHRALAHCLGEE